jgi:hypothetical protein
MTALYQIAPVVPHKTPFRLILLAKRLAMNGARRVVLALETGAVMVVAGLFFAAISALHLWEAIWKPRHR